VLAGRLSNSRTNADMMQWTQRWAVNAVHSIYLQLGDGPFHVTHLLTHHPALVLQLLLR
jgi:hypothetical protein